jgi:hypothetical protein
MIFSLFAALVSVCAGGESVVEIFSSKASSEFDWQQFRIDNASRPVDGAPFVHFNATVAADPHVLKVTFVFDAFSFQEALIDEKLYAISDVSADLLVRATCVDCRVSATDGILVYVPSSHNGSTRGTKIAQLPPSPAINVTYDLLTVPWSAFNPRGVWQGAFSLDVWFTVELLVSMSVVLPLVTIDVDAVRLLCVVTKVEPLQPPTTTAWSTGYGNYTTTSTTPSTTTATTVATSRLVVVDTVKTTGKLQPDSRFQVAKPEVTREDPVDGHPETAAPVPIGDEPITQTASASGTNAPTTTGVTTAVAPITTVASAPGRDLDVTLESANDIGAVDAIGVGGFVGIGVAACGLISLLVGVGVFCALRNKGKRAAESQDMQSARSQRSEEVVHVASDEYVAPPKFEDDVDYGVGRLDTQN